MPPGEERLAARLDPHVSRLAERAQHAVAVGMKADLLRRDVPQQNGHLRHAVVPRLEGEPPVVEVVQARVAHVGPGRAPVLQQEGRGRGLHGAVRRLQGEDLRVRLLKERLQRLGLDAPVPVRAEDLRRARGGLRAAAVPAQSVGDHEAELSLPLLHGRAVLVAGAAARVRVACRLKHPLSSSL